MRSGFVIVNDGRQNVLIGSVVTYAVQGKLVRALEKVLDLRRGRETGYITQPFKEHAVAGYYHSLECDRVPLFLERRVQFLHCAFPLSRKSAVRFLEIEVQRRSLAVNVFVAVSLCGAFRLPTNSAQIVLLK